MDERGIFSRLFCKKEFETIRKEIDFVQVNFSRTNSKGAIRGLHYQKPPYSEAKLIRCIRGKVFDVAVDVRENSPTFLKHISVELSEDNKIAIFIPEGCAHGFQTLTNDAELIYQHTEFYQPDSESSIRFNDPMIAIAWPLEPTDISAKDKAVILLNPDFKGINIQK